jgi:hypothetical protein
MKEYFIYDESEDMIDVVSFTEEEKKAYLEIHPNHSLVCSKEVCHFIEDDYFSEEGEDFF